MTFDSSRTQFRLVTLHAVGQRMLFLKCQTFILVSNGFKVNTSQRFRLKIEINLKMLSNNVYVDESSVIPDLQAKTYRPKWQSFKDMNAYMNYIEKHSLNEIGLCKVSV